MDQVFVFEGVTYPVVEARVIDHDLIVKYRFLNREYGFTLTIIDSDQFLDFVQSIFDKLNSGVYDKLPVRSKEPCPMCLMCIQAIVRRPTCFFCYLLKNIALFLKKKITSYECKHCRVSFAKEHYLYAIIYNGINNKFKFDSCEPCSIEHRLRVHVGKRVTFSGNSVNRKTFVKCEHCKNATTLCSYKLATTPTRNLIKPYCAECILNKPGIQRQAADSNIVYEIKYSYHSSGGQQYIYMTRFDTSAMKDKICSFCRVSFRTDWQNKCFRKICADCDLRVIQLSIERWYERCAFGHWFNRNGRNKECTTCKFNDMVHDLVDRIGCAYEVRDVPEMSVLLTRLKTKLAARSCVYL